MAKRKGEEPSSVEAFLERHSPGYQYGWVLALLAMTFIIMAAGPPDGCTRILTVLLQGLTLCAALLASRVGLRLFRIAASSRSVSLLAAIGSVVIVNGRNPSGVFYLLNVLLVATVPWVIARALWKRKVIDVRTVLGAVCIYVLLGMLFAFLYAAINALSSGPFFAQTSNATTPDFLYFSYVTQTTVGYGDYTAQRRSRPRPRRARGGGWSALPGDGDRGARQSPEWQRLRGRDARPHDDAGGRGDRCRQGTGLNGHRWPSSSPGSTAVGASRSRWSR